MPFFKNFRISISRLFQGVNSQQYQETVKKTNQVNRSTQKLTLCFNNELLLHFENIIQRKASFPQFKTAKDICMDLIPFGEDIKKITRLKGEPRCINNDNLENKSIHVIGYREPILDKPAKILFFTCQGKYFFGEYLFNTGIKEIQQALAGTILKKYNIAPTEIPSSFYIEDPSGSVLCFYDDGFSLFVKYYNAALSPIHDELSLLYKTQSKSPAEMNAIALENRL